MSLRSTVFALAASLPLVALAQTQPAQMAFMRADANGDGKLSKAEAARLPQVAQKFDAIDKDKDGALSMGEYMTAFEAPKQ